jgi:hypothetical protein
LQIASVAAASEQVELAKTQLEETQIMSERAEENAISVRDAILEENAVLEAANEQRQILTEQILAATSDAALQQIQSEAQHFAEQNTVFRDIGDQIVSSIQGLAAAQQAALAAAASIPSAYGGHIPNFAGGNLSRSEVFGILKAASIEKRHMPNGAGLAVANTSETIIPAYKGHIPNFQEGNISPIAAGIAAGKNINETVVAAIARSIGTALADAVKSDTSGTEANREVVDELSRIRDQLETLNTVSNTISTNTSTQQATQGTTQRTASDLRVEINTNQRDSVQVTGLENLAEQLKNAISKGKDEQVESAMAGVSEALTAIGQVLRERGLITSFGQAG